MIKIYIVDDDENDISVLQGFLRRYAKENDVSYNVSAYKNSIDFLEEYKSDGTVVFLDVEMPLLDGFSVAKRLRESDPYVGIIFITRMAQFALKGYEVSAIDYIVKPVTYFNFASKLKRAFSHISHHGDEKGLVIKISATESRRVVFSDIYYIEKDHNYIVFHTSYGVLRSRGVLKKMGDQLAENGFSQCVNGCYVNLRWVDCVKSGYVYVKGVVLPVSRHRNNAFAEDMMNYYGK